MRFSTNLAWDRESSDGGGVVEEINLSIAATDKAFENLSTGVNPLGELLSGDGDGVLSLVKTGNQGGVGDSSDTHVIGPGDESSVLVGVQSDLAGDTIGQAILVGLIRIMLVNLFFVFQRRKLG